MFWAGVGVGLFIGTPLAILILALCTAAKGPKPWEDPDEYEEDTKGPPGLLEEE